MTPDLAARSKSQNGVPHEPRHPRLFPVRRGPHFRGVHYRRDQSVILWIQPAQKGKR